MRGKIFSRQEADRMVPLLRRIVVSLRAREWLIQRKRRDLTTLEEGAGAARTRLRGELERLEEDLKGCHQELEALGCFLRDASLGIVECFGDLGGEIVYFQWRPGLLGFSFFHSLDSDHAKVRHLPELVARGSADS